MVQHTIDERTGETVGDSPAGLAHDRSVWRPRLLFVGAFPPAGRDIFGGNVTACRALMETSFPSQLELELVDSTQISNPPPGVVIRGVLAVKRLLTFLRRFERARPDAVLAFTGSGIGLAEKGLMLWYARCRGSSTLVFPRSGGSETGGRSAPLRWWQRAALRGSDVMFCQGPTWKAIGTRYLGYSDAATPVVPNWSATPRLLRIGDERQVRPSRGTLGPLRVLFVGWLESKKGVGELIEAFGRVVGEGHDAVLDLVGDGHFRSAADQMIREAGLSNRITLHGWLRAAELERLYRGSDVFALPSHSEGFPNALVEALASGLACLVTSVGNVPDYITSGINGILVPPRDVETLADALAALLGDPELRSGLSREAVALARARFTSDHAADRILAGVRFALQANGKLPQEQFQFPTS
jgi:glycosyltransferase involved in cell wall biosynthesis